MAEELQQLLEKIQRDGVDKANAEAAAIALIENLQREDLNAIEEAEGIRRLMDEFGLTQEQSTAIYQALLEKYLNGADERKRKDFIRKSTILGYVRFLYLVSVLRIDKPELMEARIRHAAEMLKELTAAEDHE